MKLLALLVTYLGVTAGLFAGVIGGVLWLVKPDPTVAQEPRVAPIPPRIADSIERKMAPPVAVTPAAIAETKVEPEPEKPAMKQADAALTHAPRKTQMRDINRPGPKKPRDERRLAQGVRATAQAPAEASARPIATARTDFPY